MRLPPALVRVLLLSALLGAAASRAEPDEALLGKARDYPVGDRRTWYSVAFRVGSWSAMDQVRGLHARTVAPAARPLVLPAMAQPPQITYRYRNAAYALDDYLAHQRVTGLLVLKDGEIVAERYRYGRTADARFLSFSMAKSITSLLVGAAQARGLIASLDDRADLYAKELAGTAYGATTVRQLLRMSSGLTFTERYDGSDDVARLSRGFAGAPGGALAVLRSVAERHAPAGEKFVYASAESAVLGRVLHGATGRTIADLTREWLWQPLGAEREAFWLTGSEGEEGTWAYFNATLRDWARLGLLARDGTADNVQVLPRGYLLEATDPQRQPRAFQPRQATPYFGYGYQFWLFPMRQRTFSFQGVHGQAVFIQPSSGIVMVQTAAWLRASGREDPEPGQERDALWRGVLRSLGGSVD
jgi:CubicO group peptidase (beta-lactamase class C family)